MRTGLITRLLVVTVVLAVIVTAGFVSLLVAVRAVDRSSGGAMHSAQEAFLARDVRRRVIDMETSGRGFIITGRDDFLGPWRVGQKELPERLARLRATVDDPTQSVRAQQLEHDVLSYVRDYSEPLVDAARRGEPWVRDVGLQEDGKRRMDDIRHQLDVFLSAETAMNEQEYTRAQQLYKRATVVAGIALVASVVVTALSAVYLARGVVRPVQRTARMAEKLADGDLEARVSEQGNAEIGVLERNFNSMAVSLQNNRDALGRLTDEQAALRHVATLVAQGRPSDEVFAAVTEEAGLILNAEITRLLRFQPDGTATVVAAWTRGSDQVPTGSSIAIDATVARNVRETYKPARRNEVSPPGLPDGSYSAVGAPILVGGSLWGAMTGLSRLDRALPADTETRMAEFTDLVGTAIANAQARSDLMASRARIVAAADEARRRIERNIHDGIQQRLVALALKVRTFETTVPPEESDLRQHLSAIDAGIVEAVDDLRELSRGIHPAILTEGGLVPALKTLARRSSVPVEVDLRVSARLPRTVEAAAYYVTAESLTNVAKHAHASGVELSAHVREDCLFLTIRDDGDGGADSSRGSGLIGLIDRVEALGGTFSVASDRGSGTTVQVELPFATPERAEG